MSKQFTYFTNPDLRSDIAPANPDLRSAGLTLPRVCNAIRGISVSRTNVDYLDYIHSSKEPMDAIRHFTTSEDGTILLKVPAAYTKRWLEIIILPADEALSSEASERLQEAHRIIDAGGGIEDPEKFLAEFEQSRQDRPLPFRD